MNIIEFKLTEAALPMIADTLKAIGHPQRLRLLEALADGEKPVGKLAELLGLPQAIVSQQLRIMRNSGVVRQRRIRTNSLYSLAHEGLVQLLGCLTRCQNHCLPVVRSDPDRHTAGQPQPRRKNS